MRTCLALTLTPTQLPLDNADTVRANTFAVRYFPMVDYTILLVTFSGPSLASLPLFNAIIYLPFLKKHHLIVSDYIELIFLEIKCLQVKVEPKTTMTGHW